MNETFEFMKNKKKYIWDIRKKMILVDFNF